MTGRDASRSSCVAQAGLVERILTCSDSLECHICMTSGAWPYAFYWCLGTRLEHHSHE